jgi:hypothetical protein
MFRLSSDRSYLTPGARHVPILIPFWGPTAEDPNSPTRGRYDQFASTGGTFLGIRELEDCDAAIFPQSWENVIGDATAEANAAAFVARAKNAGKPPVIFFWDDSSDPVPHDATIFRTSLYRSRRNPREFAQPAWAEDILEVYRGGTFPLREYMPRPVVGFCGYAPTEPEATTTLKRLRRKAGDRKRRIQTTFRGTRVTGFVRDRALAALAKHPDVDTNFILRDAFWGGVMASHEPRAWAPLRREYVQNMVDSDYILCARGGGNFSYRLYETLSLGRIPVFVDTDCVLPLDFLIDWRDYCVWVDEFDVGQIGKRVAAFHASLTPTEFADLQRACRRLWETHLSPQGFFTHFHEHFT